VLSPFCLLEPRVIISKDLAVITQVYYQVYITYQLRVSAIAAVAIIRLETIYQRRCIDNL